MHFLNEGGYHGIEPNVDMFNGGLSYILEPGLIELKKPRFDHNDQYDFSVFNTKFAEMIHPYTDGKSSERVLDAVDWFIKTGYKGLKKKPLNFLRKYKIRKQIGFFKF